MTISTPKAKYNLLKDANNAAKEKPYNKKCISILLLLILFVPIAILFAIHVYIVHYNNSVEQESFIRAQIYAIDEYLHKNFVGKKLGLSTKQNEPHLHPKLVCYYNYPNSLNDSNELLPENIDCNLCTHINVGFAYVANHTIQLSENLQKAIPLISNLRECNVYLKILLSIGGSGAEGGFSEMVSTHATRKEFIKSLKNILIQYKLDGIDLDWEFPGVKISSTSKEHRVNETLHKREKQHFSQLLREIRAEYIRERRDYLLTVAVASPETIVDAAYDVSELNQYTDFINIMAYDFHFYTSYTPFTGFNSPLYQMKQEILYLATLNINYTVHMWMNKGMDRNKLVVGLPTYGHSFTIVNPKNTDPGCPANGFGKVGNLGFTSYVDVCNFIKNNKDVTVKFNNETMSPYLYKDTEWISYEDEESIYTKGKFIKENEFGGVMVYSLNADDFSGSCSANDKFVLLRKLNSAIIDNDL